MYAWKLQFVCVALALHHCSSIGRDLKEIKGREKDKGEVMIKKKKKNAITKIYVAVVPQGSFV